MSGRRRSTALLLSLLAVGIFGVAASAFALTSGTYDSLHPWAALLASAGLWAALLASVALVVFASLALARRLSSDAAPDADGAGHDVGVQSAPMRANVTVDHEGTILTWSAAAERLTGYDAAQTIGNSFSFLFPPVTTDIGLRAQLLRTAAQTGKASTECWLVGANGNRLWMNLALSRNAQHAAREQHFNLQLRDLTETEGARVALRDREASLDRIVDSAADPMITLDAEQRIVLFNSAAERVFGCSRDQALGQPLDQFFPPRQRDAHRQHIEQFGASGTTSRSEGQQMSFTALRADGAEIPIEASISQTTLEGRKLYTLIARDVSARKRSDKERKRAQEELREQTAHQQQEHARIAAALQQLAELRADLMWVSEELRGRSLAVDDKLRHMKATVEQVLAETQRAPSPPPPPVILEHRRAERRK